MDTNEMAETPARRAVRLRNEFVAAFVEHAGPVPASERRSVTLPTLITVTAVVCVLTVVVGVFSSLVKPDKSAATTAAALPQYVAFAGWGCTEATDHGFDAHGRNSQWRTVASGGWAGDGCRSTFETLPMSGKADTDIGGQYVDWWFKPTTGSQCRVQVYVPKTNSTADTGATAAHYEVIAGRTGDPFADFTINQAQNAGQWVDGGSFPPHGGEFAVKLTDRGVPKEKGDRLAVSALKVTCA
jgi:hypothetical protein